jgi:ubiquitin-protein ligase
MEFNSDYPYSPPRIKLLSFNNCCALKEKFVGGMNICLDFLKENNWNPINT